MLRRILITLISTLVLAFVGLFWIAPVTLSYYAAKKAPAVASIVPRDLTERSVSQTPGTKLSYFGYEFELPWDDLDETQPQLYPKEKPNRVVLAFRSGLRVVVTALPAREWATNLSAEFKVSPQVIESTFGPEAMRSDYEFIKALYEFTPQTMHHWTTSSAVHYREQTLLIIKSLAPLKCANSGIFNVQNGDFKGFQQGDPQARHDELAVNLYSDESSIEMIFDETKYRKPGGITQPEINRVIQSLRNKKEK